MLFRSEGVDVSFADTLVVPIGSKQGSTVQFVIFKNTDKTSCHSNISYGVLNTSNFYTVKTNYVIIDLKGLRKSSTNDYAYAFFTVDNSVTEYVYDKEYSGELLEYDTQKYIDWLKVKTNQIVGLSEFNNTWEDKKICLHADSTGRSEERRVGKEC